MSHVSRSDVTSRALVVQRTIVAVALGCAVLLVGLAVALWAHYGTAVFFEAISAGIAGCF
ncbi:hypothetical protein A33M_4159 [Rhodovulum sp. PH10]|uniref:hypothetical protein n=1 Tax=Rhodovulum sp. PH10 TaxID=1187851 RepID=UPI00027C2976|nr:hypothetical protein A33M_4159 [Rhodovulum sp. PH10]